MFVLPDDPGLPVRVVGHGFGEVVVIGRVFGTIAVLSHGARQEGDASLTGMAVSWKGRVSG
jgi:hypothetical protein